MCVCAEFMLNCVCVSAGIVGVLVLKNVCVSAGNL